MAFVVFFFLRNSETKGKKRKGMNEIRNNKENVIHHHSASVNLFIQF